MFGAITPFPSTYARARKFRSARGEPTISAPSRRGREERRGGSSKVKRGRLYFLTENIAGYISRLVARSITQMESIGLVQTSSNVESQAAHYQTTLLIVRMQYIHE